MWGAVISAIFGGDPLSKLFSALTQAHKDALEATNDHDRILAEMQAKELDARIAMMQQATQIRLATAGFWEMRLMTFLIALPFVVHVLLVGLDTNFKTGIGVFSFPKPFDEWEGAILMSFFGLQGGLVGVKAIAAGLSMKKGN